MSLLNNAKKNIKRMAKTAATIGRYYIAYKIGTAVGQGLAEKHEAEKASK